MLKGMKSKTNHYVLIPKGEWKKFYESLNKTSTACYMSIRELGNAFGRIAKILKDDKFYKAICKANKYVEKHKG